MMTFAVDIRFCIIFGNWNIDVRVINSINDFWESTSNLVHT